MRVSNGDRVGVDWRDAAVAEDGKLFAQVDLCDFDLVKEMGLALRIE